MSNESYSQTILAHLQEPKNAGPMDHPDAVGVQGNPICGDTMKLMLRIEGERIVDARWQTVGCEPALATSSVATETAKGRTLAEIEALSPEQITAAVGGLPPGKEHCAVLAAGALKKAVATYRASHPG